MHELIREDWSREAYSWIFEQIRAFKARIIFFNNLPNLSVIDHIFASHWCCIIFHVYIFDLILSLSLLHCTDTLTTDIDTATIASVVTWPINSDASPSFTVTRILPYLSERQMTKWLDLLNTSPSSKKANIRDRLFLINCPWNSVKNLEKFL